MADNGWTYDKLHKNKCKPNMYSSITRIKNAIEQQGGKEKWTSYYKYTYAWSQAPLKSSYNDPKEILWKKKD